MHDPDTHPLVPIKVRLHTAINWVDFVSYMPTKVTKCIREKIGTLRSTTTNLDDGFSLIIKTSVY